MKGQSQDSRGQLSIMHLGMLMYILFLFLVIQHNYFKI